ncbi:MAG TPA: hypothetical protein VN829_20655 [Dongiaceae bacterium]|nr:hypothetical protein [Dongiaceae bacterium]
MAPAYPHAWVRLQRSGATLAAYFSTNGAGWVQQAWANPANPMTVPIGHGAQYFRVQ